MPPHENHRTVVAVLAGAIAVLASAAGTSVFVVGTLTASPGPSVAVAPVIHLPAAPPTLSRPPVAAPAPATPSPVVAAPAVTAPRVLTATPVGSIRSAGAVVSAVSTPVAGPARTVSPTVTLAAATLTQSPISARTFLVQAVVSHSVPVASSVFTAPASTAPPAPVTAPVVVEPAAVVVPTVPEAVAVARTEVGAPMPPVSGWRVAKLTGPKDPDLATPAPLLRAEATEAAELAAHLRSAAGHPDMGDPDRATPDKATPDRVAPDQVCADEATSDQAGADRAGQQESDTDKAGHEAVSLSAAGPAATVAPVVVPHAAGPAPTVHADGQRAVQGDGLSGPSAHH